MNPLGIPSYHVGTMITLTCTFLRGDMPVLLSWFNPSGTQISLNEISITLSDDEDFGVYRCRARNRFGIVFSEIHVEKAGIIDSNHVW